MSAILSLVSSLLGSGPSAAMQASQGMSGQLNTPTNVGTTDTAGMINPYQGTGSGMLAGGSGNNAYNTAMNPTPVGTTNPNTSGGAGK